MVSCFHKEFESVSSCITRCHAHAMPQACDMLARCHGFVEKIVKNKIKLYGEKLLQSTMF